MTQAQTPVTVVLSRTVRPGHEEEYRQLWVKESTEEMAQFPGFLGAALNEPSALNPKWVFMPRWESTAHLLAWDASPVLRRRIDKLIPLIEGGTDRQRHSGLDMWFTPTAPDLASPAPWKMILVTVIALWPTILILSGLVNLIPGITSLPWWVAPLPMLILMVPLMEFALMPAVNKIFAGFLRG